MKKKWIKHLVFLDSKNERGRMEGEVVDLEGQIRDRFLIE